MPLPEDSVGMKYFTFVFPNAEIREEKTNNLRKLGYEVMENEEGVFVKDPSMNLIKFTINK